MSEGKNKISRVLVSCAASRKVKGGVISLNLLNTPFPEGLGWEPPEIGFMAKFGTRASVMSPDILMAYSVQPVDLFEATVAFDFGDAGMPRAFALDQYPGRRWLDVRSMAEPLSDEFKAIFKCNDFDSWNIKKGTISAKTRALLSPARLETYMPEIEERLGPIDLIILPVDAHNRKAPVYAWVRRRDCIIDITSRGFEGAEIYLPMEAKWVS